jgi:phospholipid/cholesterol/gamma-HCH transport system permease protein
MPPTAPSPQITRLTGDYVLPRLTELQGHLPSGPVDMAGVTGLDTAGAWLILTKAAGASVTGATPDQTVLLDAVKAAMPAPIPRRPPPHLRLLQRVDHLGRATTAAVLDVGRMISFFGRIMAGFAADVLRPWRFRGTSLVFHMQETGFNAVPIVALMAFLIGIVIAYQGADQLRQFGAEVFVVDLIAISVLRELGILLTAIIVAGRSASAFTAAIGSMKMREEVDAMTTLGLDQVQVLVLPRVLALVLMLPALAVVADLAGLLGGGLMAWYTLGISPGLFRTRLLDTDVTHFIIGVVKAPFFALIIGVVGCFQGLQVKGNAESLGRLTSRAVVQAIFLVILADASFSILFAAAGV